MHYLKVFLIEIVEWVSFFFLKMPATPICNKLRNYYWSFRIKSEKKILHIGRNTNIVNLQIIKFGYNFCVGENSFIDASDSDAGIYFGDNVLIAGGLYMRTANHKFDKFDIPIRFQGYKTKSIDYKNGTYSIIIEDNVWIGQNVTILSGVKIGTGSIIGAGSVIVKNVEPYSIMATEPAKKISSRIPQKFSLK
jgi:acetyltransferase-like isoleucine patch superfamily enzyme